MFIYGIMLFLFGITIGSFLNVIIYRLPRGESLILPPSHCPGCRHRLGVVDLLPLAGYLWLKGRCRYCGSRISPRYPLVELTGGLLTVGWGLRFGPTGEGLAIQALIYGLLAIALIDLEHRIIPDRLTVPLLVLGLTWRSFQGELPSALGGLLAGGGPLLAAALLYPRGMGLGDVKLLAAVGVFLGWRKVLLTLFGGSLLGVLVVLPLLLAGKIDRKTPFAFGPFLAVAALVMIFGGDEILRLLYGG